jgi:hypothetical protein
VACFSEGEPEMALSQEDLKKIATMIRNYKNIGETATKWSVGLITAELAIEQVSYIFLEGLVDPQDNTD